MSKRLHDERGQTFALTAVMVLSLLAFAGFVVDVGSWFRAHRASQSTADAAALAGAQALPDSTVTAKSLALDYANSRNGGAVASGDVTFESQVMSNDTISVRAEREAQGFFTKIFGINAFDTDSIAKARVYVMAEAKYSAPFGVNKNEPYISGPGCPCYNQPTTLDLDKVGPGSFKIINIDGSHGGTGPPILADWIQNGYGNYMPLGWYYGDPGAKFNSSHVKNAMNARVGTDILFPVYDATQGNGANFQYHVVGWATFHMTSWQAHGNSATIDGYFVHIAWEGLEGGSSSNYFGTVTVQLVE